MLPLALSILPDQITFESPFDGADPLEAGSGAFTDFAALLSAGAQTAAPALMQRGSDLPVDGAELPDLGLDDPPDQADLATGVIAPRQAEQVAREARPWPASVPVVVDARGRSPVAVIGSQSVWQSEGDVPAARQVPVSSAPNPAPSGGIEPGSSRTGGEWRALPDEFVDLDLSVGYRAPDAWTAAMKTASTATPLAVPAPDLPKSETRPLNRRAETLLPAAASLPDRAGTAPIERAPNPVTALPAADVAPVPQVTPEVAESPLPQSLQTRPLQVQAAAGHGPAQPPASSLTPSTIATPVQDPGWAGQLGERVVLMTNNAMQSAEIKLSPAELGPLRIQVQVDDGAANVTFLAQHQVTREAIEQALPRLREMLNESGLNLNQANIADSGERGARQGEREAAQASGDSAELTADVREELALDDGTTTGMRRTRPDSLLDTFA
ncbi:MAG: flagellar hook-length control protein FliK [Woeseiaceae bacterium]|nr:flagellar hook-length control protein FliK [Woeseiaceae bacterium]